MASPKRFSRWGARPIDDPAAEKFAARASIEKPISLAASPRAVIGMQTRSFRAAAVAVRGGNQSARIVRGLCVPFDEIIEVEGGAEMYRVGCFQASLQNDDARLLFNSNPDKVIGRKSAGTARFTDKTDGLHFEGDLPDCSWAVDLACSMDRGDIDGTSCAFLIEKYESQQIDGKSVNVITKARLIAASVSAFSQFRNANQATSQLIAEARTSGFRLGLAAGRKEAKAKQSALRNQQGKARAMAMGLVTPTDRTREFQKRMMKNAQQ